MPPCRRSMETRVARKRLAILGAGGHSKVVIATAEAAGYEIAAVLDDQDDLWGTTLLGHTVKGPLDALGDVDGAIVAVGSNLSREDVTSRIDAPWIKLAHPSADVHPSACLGGGTVVFARTVVQPDTQIGDHSIVNTGATIDHDCCLSDFVHVAPGVHLAGEVRIGRGSLVGIGASVIPGISIGEWSQIGAGSVVVDHVPDQVTWGGVPARPLALK